MPAIERSAATAFLDIPELAWLAEAPVQPADRHRALAAAGTAWVASPSDGGRPVGFLLAEIVAGHLHIWEMSVRREHQGQGHGAALIREAVQWARSRKLQGLTLTTFVNVQWNRPFYEKLGFEVVPREKLSAELAEIVAGEAQTGLASHRRCAMVKRL